MKFYLKVINPTMAIITFCLCAYAALVSEYEFEIEGLVVGGMNTYFLAKGIFTAITIFLLGKVLERMLYASKDEMLNKIGIKEALLMLSIFLLFTFSFSGVYMANAVVSDNEILSYKPIDERSLKIEEYHHIKQSEFIKIGAKLKNLEDYSWLDVEIKVELYLNGQLSDTNVIELSDLKSMERREFVVDFDDFNNKSINDSVSCKFKINAKSLELNN